MDDFMSIGIVKNADEEEDEIEKEKLNLDGSLKQIQDDFELNTE